ncbi:hypothetical protein [Dawidia soli]|uniref:Uncharacterized protein n=1 Tax=Dawidia soli TaxID=2782352 RepID=A0AAP2D9R1_9BACT|nr:hypothetical protein [Dawidia soli]MBT1686950.1 hypothetical protein [Dawidia soli]
MSVRNRNTLKNFFRNGKSPSETEFSDLIDSTWNKVDDGLNKTENDGLKLAPVGNSPVLISFYESIASTTSAWRLTINHENNKGIAFVQPGHESSPALTFSGAGNVGIKTFTPQAELDVLGTISASGRMGGYKTGRVPADATWHTIVPGLQGFNAFEIVAVAEGNPGEGNYSMAHAIALNAHQGSKGTIKVIGTSYDWFDFRDKLRFRWRGTSTNYALQIRTGKHYALRKDKKFNTISFHVCKLWDNTIMKNIND